IYDKSEITHCPQGHEYSEDNTLIDSGKRKCKACVYKRNRDRGRKFGLNPEHRARKSQLQRERRASSRFIGGQIMGRLKSQAYIEQLKEAS
ncbi:MAG: hypothetical protein M3536_00225, partial [Actinomycetota bacterium]|nr:hypothetical protein [Actinomycetota bacterium]